MQKIIILILLLNSLYAKDTDFCIVIDKPFNDALFDITQDYDGQISAVGVSNEYKQTKTKNRSYTDAFDYLKSKSNLFGKQIHLLKIDKNADITIDKRTNMSRFSEAVSLVKTPSNGYYVGGYTLDGSLLLSKFNADADVIFAHKFGTKNYDRMNRLIKLGDGGVLAIGSSITTRSQTDNMFETGLGLNDIYITRFSKDGAKLWGKKYGTRYDDRGIDAVEAFDGSIMVLSTTSYANNKNISLMRITENGDKIWLKHYKADEVITPYKIIRLRDNNFLISLSQKDDMHKDKVRLIKFDIQNNIIFDKNIHTTYATGLKDIKEYSDGGIIGVGFVRDTYNTDALVMLFDSNLDLLHQEHYGGENYDIFNAVTILHNSQVAVAGIRTYKDSQDSNMWILKLNRDATIAQKSSNTLSLHDELEKLFKDEIASQKIIIKKDLTIEFIDSSLYFKVGKYELTKEQKDFLTKFSHKLIPLLQAKSKNIATLEVNGHSSSEWIDASFTDRYLKNEKLSMNRAFTTLSYIFKSQNLTQQVWLVDILKGSGLSYAKKITLNDKEDKEKSRRVSFRIILKLPSFS